MSKPQQRIALVVVNPQALRLGSLPRYSFGLQGGTIGSAADNWLLADAHGQVRPRHCQVLWEDGAFCLVDRSGRTHVNDNPNPLGLDVSVCLREADRLRIGPFQLMVHFEHGEHSLPDPNRHLAEHSVDELLRTHPQETDGLPDLLDRPDMFDNQAMGPGFIELMRPFDQTLLDPLHAMSVAEAALAPSAVEVVLDPRHYGMAEALTLPDLAHSRHEAFTGPPLHISEEMRMPLHDVIPVPPEPVPLVSPPPISDATAMTAALLDRAVAQGIAAGLEALSQTFAPGQWQDLEARFWEIFEQHYDLALRTEAQ